jgi:hypothetical protein
MTPVAQEQVAPVGVVVGIERVAIEQVEHDVPRALQVAHARRERIAQLAPGHA